ncbi:MAG: 3D domain-containing protein [Acidobacteria bacterium]|nr:3D domain-containing protein [Acidobacteriota bacterium]MCW5967947.1 3D domain-containing protein [Blastocatellales bacterium]
MRGAVPACTFIVLLSLGISARSQNPLPTENPASLQKAEAVAETKADPPKVSPVNPPIEFSLHPPEIKLKAAKFSEPDLLNKTAPRPFKATAYSLRGRTASGVQTRHGIVAADPEVLPLGSVVEIRAGSYSGVYTVQDTGSRVKGNLVDVWMPSTTEARQFGRRTVKLQVLRYGPSKTTKPPVRKQQNK